MLNFWMVDKFFFILLRVFFLNVLILFVKNKVLSFLNQQLDVFFKNNENVTKLFSYFQNATS